MIARRQGPDQPLVEFLAADDPVVQLYRAFFALLDWSVLPERDATHPWPGPTPHPAAA